jgi:hypothetical protein
MTDQDTIHSWFNRCSNAINGTIEQFQTNDRLMFFALADWNDQGEITYCNLNALVTQGTLAEYAQKKDDPAVYLRLDFHPDEPGELFTHPAPHMHIAFTTSQAVPRFSTEASGAGNPIAEFLDFVYRQYFLTDWTQWARRAWEDEFLDRGYSLEEEPWTPLARAYQRCIREEMDRLGEWTLRIREVLRQRRDDACDLRLPAIVQQKYAYCT